MLKFYTYSKCSTCRKAQKFLDANKVAYKEIPIDQTAPTKTELKNMLKAVGELKRLFNTSGQIYREKKLSAKLPTMSQSDAFDMLSKEGKLVKRPFVVGEDTFLVGFKEEEWKSALV